MGLILSAIVGAAPFYANEFERRPSSAQLTELGKVLFAETVLSASGKLSCASCHDPNTAFGPANDLPVQLGGRDGLKAGVRAVPSIMYGQNVPPFTEHYREDEGDDSVDQGPAGGRMWDGRAQSAHEQARLPLFSPFEMANVDESQIAANLSRSPEAARMRAMFGKHLFENPKLAFKALLLALETYQQDPKLFYPYSSKYDQFLRGAVRLSAAEKRGLAVFNDPKRGNCARCHPSTLRHGAFPAFTDFGYAAIGVPRNSTIPANANSDYVDLGLCGPYRSDLHARHEFCGMFRTPTLRNVAVRRVFFHNGAIASLRDAVAFYASRDTEPARWYRQVNGEVRKFDDLPNEFVQNLDVESPFDRSGKGPALSEGEIDDVVAFLHALTDGYQESSSP